MFEADESNSFPRVLSSATPYLFVVFFFLFFFVGGSMVRSVVRVGCSDAEGFSQGFGTEKVKTWVVIFGSDTGLFLGRLFLRPGVV